MLDLYTTLLIEMGNTDLYLGKNDSHVLINFVFETKHYERFPQWK